MNSFVLVKNKLLNAHNWEEVLDTTFEIKKIFYLPYYKNWTVETILNNRAALYKGVTTDFCLQEILKKSQPYHRCNISPICSEMMLDKTRIDSGYLLTHRFDILLRVINLLNECTSYNFILTFLNKNITYCRRVKKASRCKMRSPRLE